jgi:hypothetical protein
MKHALCGLQNQEGLHPQQDSLAACLGGNITSPSKWTAWSSSRMRPLRVVVAGGVEWRMLSDKVSLVLEVAHPFMKVPSFQMVVDASELFVLFLNLSDDGAPIGFELGTLFMVVVVAFNFSGGGEVHRTDHCS